MSREGRRRTIPRPPPLKALHAVLSDPDGDLTLFAWRTLRDVHLWLGAPVEERAWLGGEIGSERSVALLRVLETAPEMKKAARVFRALRSAPGSVAIPVLARACELFAHWLSEQGQLASAAAFADAAARQDEGSAALANLAGRAARQAGLTFEAEIWFDRGYGLAAQQKDRRQRTWALLGRGVLYKNTGRYAEAERCFDNAARIASSTRRNRLAGMAHHELLALAAERGDCEAAQKHIYTALFNYPLSHPALPSLVHDFTFLLVRKNYFTDALRLLAVVLPLVERPGVEALALSTRARAAAFLGYRPLHGASADRALALVEQHSEFAAGIHENLAQAAFALGEVTQAQSLATQALSFARARGERAVERAVLTLLAAIENNQLPVTICQEAAEDLAFVIKQVISRLQQRRRIAPRPVVFDRETSDRRERPLAS